jgi:hypothetical protein
MTGGACWCCDASQHLMPAWQKGLNTPPGAGRLRKECLL